MSDERTAEAKDEVAALKADNAALVDLLLRAAGVLRDLAGMPMEADLLADTAREPHPGAALLERVRRLEETLTTIAKWDSQTFPRVPDTEDPTKTWSYGAAYGRNGERDFMLNIAREALLT